MPRRPYATKPPSLFPFLSVLLCLLGVLIFLAASIAPASIENAEKSVELEIESSVVEHRKPVVVECLQDHARLINGSVEISRASVKTLARTVMAARIQQTPVTREMFGSDPLSALLASFAQSGQSQYVLFIVRPGGVEIFDELRTILQGRNDAFSRSEVMLLEKPNEAALAAMPRSLTARMRSLNGRLSLVRKMTPAERDQIRGLFSGPGSLAEVERLYDLSQKSEEWLDFGYELLPDEISIEDVRFVKAAQKFPPPTVKP